MHDLVVVVVVLVVARHMMLSGRPKPRNSFWAMFLVSLPQNFDGFVRHADKRLRMEGQTGIGPL
jgi:hypothetical protein